VVAALAACNQVYGLDETSIDDLDGDVDNDGFLDSVDNCPSIANNQDDTDRDGKGDACALICMPEMGTRTGRDFDRDRVDDGCDPCPRSPQKDSQGRILDEDGDGDYDACDNCPGTPNPDQLNTDSDELGDVCDLTPGFGSRLIFDPFWRKQAFWSTGWTIGDGTVTTDPNLGAEMHLLGVELSQSWSMEAGVELPDVPTASIALDLLSTSFQTKHGCTMRRGPTGWELVARSGGDVVPIAAPGAAGFVRIRATINTAQGTPKVTCMAAGVTAFVDAEGSLDSLTIRLLADVAAKFTYVDISN